jgi:hypothetical protein
MHACVEKGSMRLHDSFLEELKDVFRQALAGPAPLLVTVTDAT